MLRPSLNYDKPKRGLCFLKSSLPDCHHTRHSAASGVIRDTCELRSPVVSDCSDIAGDERLRETAVQPEAAALP